MILSSLCDYYTRLAQETPPKVPDYGFSEEKIGYAIVINASGSIVNTIPRMSTDKKPKARPLAVPRPVKRTSGIMPNFLWDKCAYVLGAQPHPNKKNDIPWAFNPNCFAAFQALHEEKLQGSDDEGLVALRLFLQTWRPEYIADLPHGKELLAHNLAFQLQGERQYLHEREAAKQLWQQQLDTDAGAPQHCLVTGAIATPARLHPAIKGVYGGQTSGVSIVSFNANAFESYGKEQGDNAPVSEVAAFQYTTALNYLLDRQHGQCLSLGDTSMVFWAAAEQADEARRVECLIASLTSSVAAIPDDEQEAFKVRTALERITQGRAIQDPTLGIQPNTRFFVLGLAPNASRLSIRYWLDTTLGELSEHLAAHYADLAMEPAAWDTPPSVWRLLLELAPKRSGRGDIKDAPAQLLGEVMRSIITGAPYPAALLGQVLQRLRSDGDFSSLRIALIKATLHRTYRKHPHIKERPPMGLEENNTNEAYNLGRLFAVLARLQSQAIGANATVTDRYFGTASTVPFSVFPRLIANAQNHLSKLRKIRTGEAVNLEKDLSNGIARLPSAFPKHLAIEDQGRFVIGYYHQRQKYFQKNDTTQSAA